MKKAIVGFFMIAAGMASFAQDIKTVKKLYDAKEHDKAKQAIDAVLAKDEKKGENWYWKHKVYSALAGSDQFKNLVPDARWQGFEAIKKYAELDKNMEVLLKDNNLGNYTKPFLDYYDAFRQDGGKELDAKNYDQSFILLRSALAVSTYFYDQKWFSSPLDTSITFYTGYAAMNAKRNDDAELYFKKLADAGAGGTDLQIGYGWLSNYYLNEKNDADKAKPIIEKGLQIYPNDEYLKSMNLMLAQKSHDWQQIMKQHETIMAGTPEFSDYLSYGADLFDYLYEDSVRKADHNEKMAKFESIMTTALTKKPGSAEGNFLLGMHYSQRIIEMEKKLKATFKGVLTPDQVTKKKAMQAEIAAEADKAIKYLDMSATLFGSRFDRLKETEKEHYKQSLNNLIYFNDKYKKDAARVKELEEKLKTAKGGA